MGRHELEVLLDKALSALKRQYPRMPFDTQVIRQEMEGISGEALSDNDAAQIGTMMSRRWGRGVEPAALGDQVWRFGMGAPPVSREIR
jgi:hypothetical protein